MRNRNQAEEHSTIDPVDSRHAAAVRLGVETKLFRACVGLSTGEKTLLELPCGLTNGTDSAEASF